MFGRLNPCSENLREKSGPMTQELPQVLYRYRPMKKHDFQSLQEGYLYFSSPQDFNDPFEFSVDPSVRLPRPSPGRDWETFKDINAKVLNISHDEVVRRIFEGSINGLLEEQERVWNEALLGDKTELVGDICCCCLSKSNDHPLMWGHYANGLKGLVIGYDTKLLASTSAWPAHEVITKVTYSHDNTIPQVDYTDLLTAAPGSEQYTRITRENFVKCFCTKSSYWAYEEEYRLLWQLASNDDRGKGKKVIYPTNTVKEIIFGELMDEELRSDVLSLFEGSEVVFKLAVKSKTHYALTLESLN